MWHLRREGGVGRARFRADDLLFTLSTLRRLIARHTRVQTWIHGGEAARGRGRASSEPSSETSKTSDAAAAIGVEGIGLTIARRRIMVALSRRAEVVIVVSVHVVVFCERILCGRCGARQFLEVAKLDELVPGGENEGVFDKLCR